MKRAKEGTASRNLVIYDINQRPAITEDMIRHDLYHIHNMVVIYVQFSEGNAYLSTNSVSNALYARTCMLSRTLYRGLEISFYPDECDGDIDDMDDSAPPYTLPPVERRMPRSTTLMMCFQLRGLRMRKRGIRAVWRIMRMRS
jgi:hypothetical protein